MESFDAEESHAQSIHLTQLPIRILQFTKNLFWMLLGFGLFILVTPWQQTADGSGRVVAYSPTERQQSIDAPVDGRLGVWFVNEGSIVQEGDPIVEIFDNDPEILSRLDAEKRAVEARVEAAELAVQTAKINLKRQEKLSDEGLSSRRSFELAKIEYAKFVTDLANGNAELVKVQTRIARQSTQFVKAPRTGTILRRTAGERSVLVKTGETIAEIVPTTDSRAVELWIDGNDVPLTHEGQEARLQFEGWPAIQFSGWPSVAIGTFKGRVAVVDATDNGKGSFRVLITADGEDPWPPNRYLRQGVRAKGWLLLGTVTVGYELWRRFNGFPPASKQPPWEKDVKIKRK